MADPFRPMKAIYTDTSDETNPQQYKVLHKLASGRYGDVQKVELITTNLNQPENHNDNDEDDDLTTTNDDSERKEHDNDDPSQTEKEHFYALKSQEIFNGEITPKLQREIDIMNTFKSNHNHTNVIQMISCFQDSDYLLFLLPFYDSNLDVLLQNAPLKIDLIRHIMHESLNGLAHIHSLNIIHRDIKPNNILFCTQTQRIVIADFGSARDITSVLDAQTDTKENKSEIANFDDPEWNGFDTDTNDKLSPQIYVVSYRAPELLVGERHYRFPVDVWAMGCIMAQMCRDGGAPLFDKDHDIPQFMQQIQILGGPKDNELENVGLFSVFFVMEASDYNPMNKVVDNMNESGCDLLSKLLRLGPTQRFTAKQALSHSFFDDINKQSNQ
eukprot:13766_1